MDGGGGDAGPAGDRRPGWLGRVVEVREGEVRAMWMGCAYFFFLLSGYFILRPIRDEIGVASGVRSLPWLFAGTLVATLALHPLFSALVVKFPVRTFIPITYRFFIANLIVFYLLAVGGQEGEPWVGVAFWIWTSVFNLFVVSVFWGFMADSFREEQGKRLFGFIGFGGTAGGIAGSAITAVLVASVGTKGLLLVSAGLLECAVQVVKRFPRLRPAGERAGATSPREQAIGGGVLAGMRHIARSPYLLGICLYMLMFTIGSTFLYFQQTDIVGRTYADREARTSFLARMDLAVQTLTIVVQLLITGRLLRYLGVGFTLAVIPALSIVGFSTLGMVPTLAVFVVFQVLRRAGEYSLTRPAREVLYTVVSREDKYKAKSFIDTFVYRVGDQVGAWSEALLRVIGLTTAGIALAAVPVSAVWLVTALWLGRRQRLIARGAADPLGGGAPAPAPAGA